MYRWHSRCIQDYVANRFAVALHTVNQISTDALYMSFDIFKV